MKLKHLIATLCCGIGLAAGVAHADGPPSGTNSSIPAGIILVGMKDGVPDPKGAFTCTIRDVANNSVPNDDVYVSFAGCSADSRIAAEQNYPGETVVCGTPPTVHATTDEHGVARFNIVGGSINTGATPGAGFKCATIFSTAEGNLGTTTVAILDQNGSGGVTVLDASLALSDVLHSNAVGRSDYNFSNSVTIVDVSQMLGIVLLDRSPVSATAYCQ